jgi:hypothetical protein
MLETTYRDYKITWDLNKSLIFGKTGNDAPTEAKVIADDNAGVIRKNIL